MVRRILGIMEREFRGLHAAAYVLGLFAIFSQLLALIRDRLLAGQFGAGPELDIYYAAFRIPDVIFVGVASFVSLYVIIPLLSERSKKEQSELLSGLLVVFTLLLLASAAAAFLLAPRLVPLLFPGFADSPHLPDLIALTRLLLIQLILLGLSNLFGSVTQLHHKFLLYAVSPLLYNVGIIAGIVFLYAPLGLMGLGLGVLLGALLHLLIQVPFVLRSGLIRGPYLSLPLRDLGRVVAISLPRTIGLSLGQLTLLIMTAIASLMLPGSIAVFNFSLNLQSVPLAIIGVSYSVAAFPTLSRLIAGGDTRAFSLHVLTALRHILFWSLPAIALIVVLRAQIVRVILGSGEFDWTDTRLTAAALGLFVVSLAAQGTTLLLARAYYAAGNTRRPLFINALSAIVAITLAPALVTLFESMPVVRYFIESLLRLEGIPGTALIMLPLAFSVGSLLNAVLLWIFFRRDFVGVEGSIARPVFESLSAAVVSGFAAYHMLQLLDDVVDIDTFLGIATQGLAAGLFGVIAGGLLLVVLRNHEILEIRRALMDRLRTAPIVPEQEEL